MKRRLLSRPSRMSRRRLASGWRLEEMRSGDKGRSAEGQVRGRRSGGGGLGPEVRAVVLFPVYFGEGEQAGDHEGPDDDAHEPIDLQAAQDAQEEQEHGQLGALADED